MRGAGDPDQHPDRTKMSRIQNTGSQFRLNVHESSLPLTVSKLPEAIQNDTYLLEVQTRNFFSLLKAAFI